MTAAIARHGGASAAALLLATGADALLGDPRRGHPVAAFGRIAARVERAGWRPTRRAGAVHATLLAGAAALLAHRLERAAARRLGALGTVAVRAALVWACLGGRSLQREAAAVERLVAGGDLPAARRRIRSLVGRDPERLDATELRRAVIESLAENVADAVVASHVWTLAAGGPGVVAHRAVNTLDAMVGNRSPRFARFGTPAARADDVLNWPAARWSAALTAGLAPLVGGSPRRTARTVRADAGAHPSPNAGVAESAFAGALDLRLGGTLAYAGRVEHRPVLHVAGRDPQATDVARAVRLAQLVGAASAATCATASLLLGGAR